MNIDFNEIRIPYTHKCARCGQPFYTEKPIRKNRSKNCQQCRKEFRDKTRPQNIEDLHNITQISKRTVSKIIIRMELSCSACGWDRCVGDIHHIIPRKDGGSDDHSNLTYLCPNCHREIHNGLEVPYVTFEEQVGDTWKEYYNIETRH